MSALKSLLSKANIGVLSTPKAAPATVPKPISAPPAALDPTNLFNSVAADSAILTSQNQGSDLRFYLESLQNISNAYAGRAEYGPVEDGGADYLKVLRTTLDSKVGTYNQNSQRLVDYSEMHATNTYIQNELRREMDETQAFINKLRNKIFTSKQNSQEYIYQLRRHQHYLFLLLLTVTVVLLMLMMVRMNMIGVLGGISMFALIIVIGVAYTVIMVVSIIRNTYRTSLDWSKFYWDVKKQNKSCVPNLDDFKGNNNDG